MIRYICFDTETTGLDPIAGDRVIEIGCVELVGDQKTGREYHQLINPQLKLSEETIRICQITDDMLVDKPLFADIADSFLNFLEDIKTPLGEAEKTILVAHNATFDLGFLNHELSNASKPTLSKFETIDTLDIAHKRYPGQKASLDAICERLGISIEERKQHGHGALLDAQLLADVFIKMMSDTDMSKVNDDENIDFVGFQMREKLEPRAIYSISAEEEELNKQLCQENKVEDL